MPSKGVIYIATSPKFIAEAQNSAMSVKKSNPHLPITIFTDGEPQAGLFDQVIRVEDKNVHYGIKVYHMAQSPYEQTLFLDTDTHVAGDLSDLFKVLDRFDIAAAHAPVRYSGPCEGVPDSFIELNSGVILFRKNQKTQSFFEHWLNLYEALLPITNKDQPTFRRALYETELQICVLPPEYNCRYMGVGFLNAKGIIFHARHPLVEEVIDSINSLEGSRLFIGAKELVTSYKLEKGEWITHSKSYLPNKERLVSTLAKSFPGAFRTMVKARNSIKRN